MNANVTAGEVQPAVGRMISLVTSTELDPASKPTATNFAHGTPSKGGVDGGAFGSFVTITDLSRPPVSVTAATALAADGVAFSLGPTTIHDDVDSGVIVDGTTPMSRSAPFSAPMRAHARQVAKPRSRPHSHAGDDDDKHLKPLLSEQDSEPPSAYQSPNFSPSITAENSRFVAGGGGGGGDNESAITDDESAPATVNISAAASDRISLLFQRKSAQASAVADGESEESTGRLALMRKVRSLRSPVRHGMASAGLQSIQSRWRRVSNAVAGLFRANKLVAQDRSEFVNENTTALVQAQTGELDVSLEVINARDLTHINYARQGNKDLYSGEMLIKRRALRTHPQVMEAIRTWWLWLPKSSTRLAVVVSGDGSSGEVDGEVAGATLDEPIYSAMVVAVTLVLLPRFGLPSDPNYDPKEDWLDDNKGKPFMDFPNFFDALFELADMWAEGVSGPEYAELLKYLLHGVQNLERKRGTFGRLLKKFGHKPAPVTASASTPPNGQHTNKAGEGGNARRRRSDEPSPPPSRRGPMPNKGRRVSDAARVRNTSSPMPALTLPEKPPMEEAGMSAWTPRSHSQPHATVNRRPRQVRGGSGGGEGSDDQFQPSSAMKAHNSRVQLPEYEQHNYSGVQSTLLAYLRQPLPKALPRRIAVNATGDSGYRPGSTGGSGSGACGSDSARRRQSDGRRTSDESSGGGAPDSPSLGPAKGESFQPSAVSATIGGVGVKSRGGGNNSGQPLQQTVYGGNWQLGDGCLMQAGALVAATAGGSTTVGTTGASDGLAGESSFYGNQGLLTGGILGGGGGGISPGGGGSPGAGLRRGLSVGSGLRNVPSSELLVDMPYGHIGSPGSLYAEYMDAVLSRHAHRNHGSGSGGTGGDCGGSDGMTSPPPQLSAQASAAGLTILGAPPPMGTRIHVDVHTVGGDSGSIRHDNSPHRSLASDSASGGGGGIPLRRRHVLLTATDSPVAVAPPVYDLHSVQSSFVDIPEGTATTPPDQQLAPQQQQPGLQQGRESEAGWGRQSESEGEARGSEEEDSEADSDAQSEVEGRERQQHERDGGEGTEWYRSVLPALRSSISLIDPGDRLERLGSSSMARRGTPSLSALGTLPSTSSPSLWMSSPPPMVGLPMTPRHTFLYAAAPVATVATVAAESVPSPPPLRLTPSAGICITDGSTASAPASAATSYCTTAASQNLLGHGRAVGPAPILITVNSGQSAVVAHSGGGGGSSGGGAGGFLPNNIGGGNRSPGGGGGGGCSGGAAEKPQGLAALAAAAAAHLPGINSNPSPLMHEGVPLGMGFGGHGGSPGRYHNHHYQTYNHHHHNQHQLPSQSLQLPGGSNVSGGGSGGVSAAVPLHGNASVPPPSKVSWASTSSPHAVGGSGGNGGGTCVMLPYLSLDSTRLQCSFSGGSSSRSGGGGGSGTGGGAGTGSRGVYEAPPPPPPPPQARRDPMLASRTQVISMTQALLAQQQQQQLHVGSAGGRLDSLRPVDGGHKRAQCGGSFLTYLQQGLQRAAAASGGGGTTVTATAAAAATAGGCGGDSCGGRDCYGS